MAFASAQRVHSQSIAEINITPLIDVMLALLLIFMLATPVLSGKLPLPLGGRPEAGAPPQTVELTLGTEGQVLRDGRALTAAELEADLVMLAGSGKPVVVQLRPAAATSHQHVVATLSLIRQAGLEQIAIETPR
ncbi:ExbD/TolR family protein [Tahibacter amnicola]|uniref:Biopolymer transporter ExbD n=1 Tax=Tahibacter amnicola TaxID=2976241 RepID=A0ABY6BEG1_9GAMM|nr:biopolymer transporter ExbD [Tahibacter amnicola]UXI68423.1 biopolymer transporter ExbD [Tahibacter amnicola]